MNTSIILEKFKALSNKQKMLVLVVVLVGMFGGWIWMVYLPKKGEITQLNEEVSNLNNQISINRTKAMRLDDLKRENDRLQRRLARLKEQLPPEAEVELLLKQVSELGIRTGLDFKLWKPSDPKASPDGLYTEIPVSVEIAGGYHALGAFFDRISKLSRIINISNIRMGNAKGDRDKILIDASFVATAFASRESKAASP